MLHNLLQNTWRMRMFNIITHLVWATLDVHGLVSATNPSLASKWWGGGDVCLAGRVPVQPNEPTSGPKTCQKP